MPQVAYMTMDQAPTRVGTRRARRASPAACLDAAEAGSAAALENGAPAA
jgi:hypothetical protein